MIEVLKKGLTGAMEALDSKAFIDEFFQTDDDPLLPLLMR